MIYFQINHFTISIKVTKLPVESFLAHDKSNQKYLHLTTNGFKNTISSEYHSVRTPFMYNCTYIC